MSKRKRTKVIEEFINLYKSEPCLWRVKSKEYHDRALRDAAYTKLLTKLKESEPDAVRDTVVKKINNLRSNFRKEKKKIDASKKSGAATDDLYKTTLWYYNLFDFLGDQDTPSTSVSNLDYEERSESDDDTHQEQDNSEKDLQFDEMWKQNIISKTQKENEVLDKALEIMSNKKCSDDDAQIFGNFVASSIRNIRSDENRRKLKRKIQSAILEIEDLDDISSASVNHKK